MASRSHTAQAHRLTVVAWIVAFLIFFPILWTSSPASRPRATRSSCRRRSSSSHWTLENYVEVQSRSNYFKRFFNSIVHRRSARPCSALIIAVPGGLVDGVLAARKRTKDILMWMLSTKMMPAVGVLVPIYLIFQNLRPARHAASA